MTHARSRRAWTPAMMFFSAMLFLAAMAAHAAAGGATSVGQSIGTGASAPGTAASDPPKSGATKATPRTRGPREAASGNRMEERREPQRHRGAASAP